MPIPIHSFPSDYDMFGSRRHTWEDNLTEIDEQTWQENSLYRRRHEGLYLSKFEREQEEEESE